MKCTLEVAENGTSRIRSEFRHCEELLRRSNPLFLFKLDCFAQPNVGQKPTFGWLAMTNLKPLDFD